MKADEIVALVQRIAELLEPGAREVWALAVRQATITGIVLAAFGAVTLGLGAWCLVKTLAPQPERYYPEDRCGWVIGAFLAIPVGLLLIAVCIAPLANPEWYAIGLLHGLL